MASLADIGTLEQIERQTNQPGRVGLYWPIGEPLRDGPNSDGYHTAAGFIIARGVDGIVNVDALADLTATYTREVRQRDPSIRTTSGAVTHDGPRFTSGIVYFGYKPGRGDQEHRTMREMLPTFEYVFRLICPAGGLSIEQITDPYKR